MLKGDCYSLCSPLEVSPVSSKLYAANKLTYHCDYLSRYLGSAHTPSPDCYTVSTPGIHLSVWVVWSIILGMNFLQVNSVILRPIYRAASFDLKVVPALIIHC